MVELSLFLRNYREGVTINEENQPQAVKSLFSTRQAVICGSLLLVAFLVGFIPMWLKDRDCFKNLS